jgi:DNA-binding transcriptional regulator YiaG
MRSYKFYAFDDIELEDGYLIEDTSFGETFAIEDQEGLERAIVRTFVFKEDGLTGAQVKAIRRALELTQQALAEALGVDRQTVLRWESEVSAPSRAEDFFIRFFAAERWFSRDVIGVRDGGQRLEFPRKLRFKWTGSNWVSRQFPAVHSRVLGKAVLSASSPEKTIAVWNKIRELTSPVGEVFVQSEHTPPLGTAPRVSDLAAVFSFRRGAIHTVTIGGGSATSPAWTSEYDLPFSNELALADADASPSVLALSKH